MRSRLFLAHAAVLAAVVVAGCRADPPAPAPVATASPGSAPRAARVEPDAEPDARAEERARMVEQTIAARGIRDERVLAAMRRVPRHRLVPEALQERAYEDRPLPIGFEQTISQPFVVAAMTAAARLSPGERVLEVGTGSGYQAAVLAELGVEVYSIEIVEPLAVRTHALLRGLGYERLHLRIGDGHRGWPEAAPFDAILVTAAPSQVPQALIDQLAVGGRLVIPVGERDQQLQVLTRGEDGTTTETLFRVRFVPMTGAAGQR